MNQSLTMRPAPFTGRCAAEHRDKYAADGGDSARFTDIFLASRFFWSQTFICTRPLSAASASRWALHSGKMKK